MPENKESAKIADALRNVQARVIAARDAANKRLRENPTKEDARVFTGADNDARNLERLADKFARGVY